MMQEAHLDKWFRDTYYKLIDISRNQLANVTRADVGNLVLVENASSAVNSCTQNRMRFFAGF